MSADDVTAMIVSTPTLFVFSARFLSFFTHFILGRVVHKIHYQQVYYSYHWTQLYGEWRKKNLDKHPRTHSHEQQQNESVLFPSSPFSILYDWTKFPFFLNWNLVCWLLLFNVLYNASVIYLLDFRFFFSARFFFAIFRSLFFCYTNWTCGDKPNAIEIPIHPIQNAVRACEQAEEGDGKHSKTLLNRHSNREGTHTLGV